MNPGRGHITQLGPNRYRVRVSAGRDPRSGKRRQPSRIIHGTRADAEDALTDLADTHRPHVRGTPHTFDELFHMWNETTAAQSKRRHNTVYIDEGLYKNHIKPTLGDMPIASIRPGHLNVLYDDLLTRFKPATVLKIHAKIGAVLQYGVRREYVHRNVATLAEAPQVRRVDPTAPTTEEVFEVLDHMYDTDSDLWLLYRLSATLGLRRGEIPALTYGDLDFTHHTLRIHRSVTTVPGRGIEMSDTKTGEQGHGLLKLDKDLIDVLRQRRHDRISDALATGIAINDIMIFPGRDLTTPQRPDSISQKVRRYYQRHPHLPHITIKDLRTYVATELEELGHSLMTAKAVLRHASEQTTARYYVAARATTARQATATLGDRLGQQVQKKVPTHQTEARPGDTLLDRRKNR